MISVSQDWKNIQKAIVRPEGYVQISATGITLTKQHFQTFKYTQSGKIDNSVIPTGEIYVEILKSSSINYDLDTSLIYQLQFGFNINGTPEMISVGYFMIKDKQIPANGLVAKYTFTDNFTAQNSGDTPYFLSETYKGGSDVVSYQSGSMYQFSAWQLFERVGGDTSVRSGSQNVGHTLNVCSYGEVLQQVALISGKLLKCKPNYTYQRYTTNALFLESLTDYVVGSALEYQKPETEHEKPISNYTVVANEDNLFAGVFETGSFQIDEITVNTDASSTTVIEFETGKYISLDYDRTTWQGNCHFLENKLYIVNSSNVAKEITVKLLVSSIIQEKPYTFNVSNDGDEISVNSPLLFYESDAHSDPYITNADTCGAYLQQTGALRDVITVPCRIDPRLELFDYISIELPNGQFAKGYVENFTVNFNGAFNGEVSIRVQSITETVKLTAPTIILTTNNTWLVVHVPSPNAEEYEIYLDGNYITSINDTSLNISSYTHSGVNSFRVKAKANGYIDSDFSNTATATYRLKTPTLGSVPVPVGERWHELTFSNIDGNATYNKLYAGSSQTAFATISTDVSTFDLKTINFEAGTYTIYAISIAQGYIDSEQSNIVVYHVPLFTPVISIDDNILTVQPVQYATEYDIYADDTIVATLTNELSLNLTTLGLSAGSHSIKAKAQATGYYDSDFSNVITWIVKLATPTISISGATLTISAVPNATSYNIYDSDVLIGSTSNTTYSLASLSSGYHYISVIATSTEYVDSDRSNVVEFATPLATPAISLSGNILTITSDPNATSNHLYANNTLIYSTSGNIIDLQDLHLEAGTYTLKVKSSASGYLDSNFSTTRSYTVPLYTPVISLSGNILTVQAVQHATSYDVYVDNVVKTTLTSQLTIDLVSLSLSGGNHNIKVKAKATGYTTSDFSNTVSWATQLATPVISINNTTLTISSIPNATNYDVYVNGTVYANTQTTTFSLSALTTGNYDIKVKAKANNYISSEYSNTLSYRVKLDAPTISINDNTLTISRVALASTYDIFVDGTFAYNTPNTTFDLLTLSLLGANYSITVKAKSSVYDESAFSNAETYVAPLSTPTSLSASGSIVSATVDDRSTSVEVFIDDVSIGELSLNGGE